MFSPNQPRCPEISNSSDLVMWGVFTFYMWIGSLALNRAVQSVFLALWITFFLLGAADLAFQPLLDDPRAVLDA